MSEWKKKNGRMQTPWFEEVDPLNPFPEYPRPQIVRKEWVNLNGLWDYKITDAQTNEISTYTGKILVPFPIESSLSGVMKPLLPKDRLWYRRIFRIPTEWDGNKILLHFGAVDWESTVWVNGKEIGVHKGGYSPFSFDVTDSVLSNQDNEIIVRVYDPTDQGRQPFGKQTLKPKTVFYTPSSGIWQTVWLEKVSPTYIESFILTPNIDNSTLTIEAQIQGDNSANTELLVRISKDGNEIASTRTPSSECVTVKLENQQLWSPESPELYDIQLVLLYQEDQLDLVDSYFAMRKFSLQEGPAGISQFFLNNKPYFMIGPLDQGFWPDGLYTATSDAALLWDIEMTKSFGFNMIRKHIKTEPARWYHHCDKLGIIVWQDMPNGGKMSFIPPGYLAHFMGRQYDDTKRHGKFGYENLDDRDQFEKELKELVDSLRNTPSLAIWVPFNEAWGQFDAKRIAEWLMDYDPTRLVDHTSGWFDQGSSHFLSLHNYQDTFKMVIPSNSRGILLSETGGYTYKFPGHVWNPKKKFGYKSYKNKDELHVAYKNMVENVLKPAIEKGLSGVVYTQTSDVEIEYNGLVTYDRQVLKMDPEVIKLLNESLRDLCNKT
ncbi:MAG: glycoside hydrolase family 2 protein [Promethearchaeota archaeon]